MKHQPPIKNMCKLCRKICGYQTKGIRKHLPTVRVKGDLFGEQIDMVFHEKCWNKLKIYDDRYLKNVI
jgi:hypothetical protein